MRLEGKIALVTGALSGIGAAVAERFAAEGAMVVAADIAAVPGGLGEGQVAPLRVDVGDEASVAACIGAVEARHGRLDVVVNCAGIGHDVAFLDTSAELFDRTVAVNLRARSWWAGMRRSSAPTMRASSPGTCSRSMAAFSERGWPGARGTPLSRAIEEAAHMTLFGNKAQESQEHYPVEHTDAEWRRLLPPEGYRVLRQHGTERAGTSPLNGEKREGVFVCAGCGQTLFASADKFESGTGWPSFTRPEAPGVVGEQEDRSLWARRTEVHCSRCGGHLGHVFADGPAPTGQRYCMNGAALAFEPK